ncbi:MAG: hypothetical protein AAFW75_15935 [Cyanobacteria bacterium J06636_16]
MAVLVVLLVAFAIALLVQRIRRRPLNVRLGGRMALAVMFLFAGFSHFGLADSMVQMLPRWIPLRYPIIYVTGLMELVIGLGFLWSQYARLAGVAAIAFLLGVFPANMYAALNAIEFGGNVHGPIYLLFRVPLQLFLMGWTWFMAVRPSKPLSR